MASLASLYDNARFAVVGAGSDRVRLCVTSIEPTHPVAAQPRRVLLIHGNPSHLDHWIHTVPALRDRAAIVAYDQTGLGKSDDFANAKHSLERSVDVALAVLDDVGWTEPIDIVGQSHGGLVAVALAARAPERVRSIVLLGTGGTPAHPTYRLLRLPGLDRLLFALGRAAAPKKGRHTKVDAPRAPSGRPTRAHRLGTWLEKTATAAIRAAAFRSFSPDPVPHSVVEDALHAPPTILRTMVRLAQDRPCDKVAEYARRVRSPVLFIHGRDDGLVNVTYARRLYDVMRRAGVDARFVELDGGHMVHFSRPSTVNPRLDAWLASSSAASVGSSP